MKGGGGKVPDYEEGEGKIPDSLKGGGEEPDFVEEARYLIL